MAQDRAAEAEKLIETESRKDPKEIAFLDRAGRPGNPVETAKNCEFAQVSCEECNSVRFILDLVEE